MKLELKSGIGELLFGMKEKDVTAILGMPSKKYKDDEDNVIYLYNDLKLRLTFYSDENLRLGYIITSSPSVELFQNKIIGQNWENIQVLLQQKGIIRFEEETFDSVINFFNEDNWLIFQTEFDEVIRIEIGAIINHKDEFDWKFKA